MTEQEWRSTEQEWWLTSENIIDMCNSVTCSDRKLYLFSVACCREIWHLLGESGKQVIEILERYADGLVDEEKLAEIREMAYEATIHHDADYTVIVAAYAVDAAVDSAGYAHHVAAYVIEAGGFNKEESEACNFFRNFVNPYHKLTFKPSQQAKNLAEAIYQIKDWLILPILADMLEEEGCTDTILLNHLRTKEQVYKGWWSLDVVRGV